MELALERSSVQMLKYVLTADPEAATECLIGRLGFDPPLCRAIRNRCKPEIVRLLLQHGADCNESDGDDRSPLLLLAQSGQPLPNKTTFGPGFDSFVGCMSLATLGLRQKPLRQSGSLVPVEAATDVLQIVLDEQETEQIDIALSLLGQGADPSVVDSEGRSTGQIAIDSGRMRLASVLNNYRNVQACFLLEKFRTRNYIGESSLATLQSDLLCSIQGFLVDHTLFLKLRTLPSEQGFRI